MIFAENEMRANKSFIDRIKALPQRKRRMLYAFLGGVGLLYGSF